MKTLILLAISLFSSALFAQDAPTTVSKPSTHGIPFVALGTSPFPESISIAAFNTKAVLKGISLPKVATDNVIEYEVFSYTVSLISKNGVSEIKVATNSLESLQILLDKASPGDLLLITDIKSRNSEGNDYYLETVSCKLSE